MEPVRDDARRAGAATATPPDPWTMLRRHTPARIALGRAGASLPTAEVLRFAAAHAAARDAVHEPLDVDTLAAALRGIGLEPLVAASRAAGRADYLARPDLGRRLDDASRAALEAAPRAAAPGPCVVVADGLSAVAAQRHAVPLVAALRAALAEPVDGPAVALGPVVVATQARVALGDEIGAALGAPLVLVLIGERPGLSSPDSLGAYLTWAPAPGRVDSERNCVSNIRPEGLAVPDAARRLAWLLRTSLRRRLTGVGLKDESDPAAIDPGRAPPPALA
ncbi:MAG: ethanolamine ammonia-lyase subunit EutC [Burkholderiaceae bacterium]